MIIRDILNGWTSCKRKPSLVEELLFNNIIKSNLIIRQSCNRSCNLRWCTRKENSNYELTKKSRSKSHTGTTVPSRWKNVIQLSLDGEVIKEWESLTAASMGTNTLVSSISSCCSGKFKTANGFIWKYKNE